MVCIPITLSSRFWGPLMVRLTVSEHRPEHVDPPSRQRDYRLVVSLAFSPLAQIESPAGSVKGDAAERRPVQHTFEDPIAASGPPLEAGIARTSSDGHQTSGGGQRVGRGEA